MITPVDTLYNIFTIKDFFFCLRRSLQRKTTADLKTKHMAWSSRPCNDERKLIILFLFPGLCKLSTLQTKTVQITFCFPSGNSVMYIWVPLTKWFDSSHKKMIYLSKISIPLMCYVTLCYLLNFSQEIWDVEPLHTTVVEKVPGGEINWLKEIHFPNANWNILPHLFTGFLMLSE